MSAETSGTPAVPEGVKVVTEGRASILQKGNAVFYNPAQVANRDISLAVLRWFIKTRAAEFAAKKPKPRRKELPKAPILADRVKGVRILEGLAATGLRAIRYAMELDGVGRVIANDMDASVVEAMQRNIDHNGEAAQSKIRTSNADARLVMMQNLEAFDAVDLDPYGSPATLLDGAVQAVNEGGLLMVTATDMAVLCGNHAETCYTKYGSYSLHRSYGHEQALRVLLSTIQTHAARHKRYVVPILSLSIDFYVRLFMRVYTSALTAKESASKLSFVWQSTGCDAWWLQPAGRMHVKPNTNAIKYQASQGPAVPQRCPISGGSFLMGGPIWNGRLHDPDATHSILQNIKFNPSLYPSHAKLTGLLTAVSEELLDAPLYYNLHDLARSLRAQAPKSDVFRNALVNAGYQASMTHCHTTGFKTDAPPEVVYDILRCWVKKNPVKIVDSESYQAKILAKEPVIQADFSNAPGSLSKARKEGKPRFVQNPDNWGPRPRHGKPMLAHEIEAEAAAASEAAKPDASTAATDANQQTAGTDAAQTGGTEATQQAAGVDAEQQTAPGPSGDAASTPAVAGPAAEAGAEGNEDAGAKRSADVVGDAGDQQGDVKRQKCEDAGAEQPA